MSEESFIGGTTARVGQMIFLIISPAILFAFGFSSLKNWSANDLIFLSVVLLVLCAIVRYTFMFDEVYANSNTIISYKLFSKKRTDFEDIISIEKSLIPFTIKIVTNRHKIRFFMKLSDVKKQMFSGDPDIVVNDLRLKLEKIESKTTSNK